MKLFRAILAFALALVCLAACAPASQQGSAELAKEQTNLGFLQDADGEIVLALNTELVLTTARPDLRETLVGEAKEQVFALHELIDGHHAYTDDSGAEVVNIAYLNDHFGEGPIQIDPALFEVLEESLRMAELTQGYFNPTVGKLVDAYEGRFDEAGAVQDNPEQEAIEQAMRSIVPVEQLPEHILLDPDACTVELLPYEGERFRLTLGAIGKGFALSKYGPSADSSFLLTAGASSIRAHKAEGEDVSWNVATHAPDSEELLFAFGLDEGAVSTSGDDQNYYLLEDGTRVHHILNPYTGASENFYRNVVLVGEDAGILDALSTALFNVEDEAVRAQILEAVEAHYGSAIDYCFVMQKGEGFALDASEGFKDRLIDEYTSSSVVEGL